MSAQTSTLRLKDANIIKASISNPLQAPSIPIPPLPPRRNITTADMAHLESPQLSEIPESWYDNEEDPDAPVKAYLSHMARVHSAYEAADVDARAYITEHKGKQVIRSTPVPSPMPANDAFLRPWIYIEKGEGDEWDTMKIPLESLPEYEAHG